MPSTHIPSNVVKSNLHTNRINNRVLVANATFITDENDSADTWLPSLSEGANWAIRNSTLGVMIPDGSEGHARGMAIVGITKSTDIDTTAIGVSGLAIGNRSNKSAWGGYYDLQWEDGKFGYGLEVVCKNKMGSVTTTPYTTAEGSDFGVQINGGGDPAYGGTATDPSTAGIIFTGTEGWNRGIVAKSGTCPTGIFMDLPDDYELRWSNTAGTDAAIEATGTGSDMDIKLRPGGSGTVNISGLPTSASGLSSGDLWNNSGVVTVV